jgi:DNA polymerase III subunit beta
MQVKLATQNLTALTARLSGVLGEKSLAYVALRTDGNILFAQASDRVLSVFCEQSCETLVTGDCFIPGKIFCSIIKELPSTQVELKVEGPSLKISTAKEQFSMKIPRIEGLEWKAAPAKEESSDVAEVTTTALAYMLEQIRFCVQSESQRIYGKVAYLHKTNSETLRLVGSDGFRLSYGETQGDFPQNFLEHGVCLSKKSLEEILKLTQEPLETLSMSLVQQGAVLRVAAQTSVLYILLVNTRYPAYQSVIPERPRNTATISRNNLQGMLRRIMLASDKSKTLQLNFAPKKLMLKAHTQGETEGREILCVEDYNGESCQLFVNGKFLADVLACSSASKDLTLNFSDNQESISLLPTEEPLGCRSLHVLVPINE